jgi:uncharacterized membrane protein YoaK (UPF0700 family)
VGQGGCVKGEVVQASPGWVLAGGCGLAFLAAAVNADFMLRFGISVSHLTGDLSRVSAESVRSGGLWSDEAQVLLFSILGFVGGAATSGFFIHHPSLDFRRPYGRTMVGIGLLLVGAGFLTNFSVGLACLVAAWACGMQNALATRFRGVILRTTHITGLLTDLGQNVGMLLRGHVVDRWLIVTPLGLAAAFLTGAGSGALAQLKLGVPVTPICGAAYVLGGVLWSLWKRRGWGGGGLRR